MKKLFKTAFLAITSLLFLTTAANAEIVAQGSWTKKEHKIEGTWKINKEGENAILIISDLKTKNAPDLKLYFSTQTVQAVSAKTATSGSFFLKDLTSNKGTQTYKLPAGFDISKYKSLLIHCNKYTKLWGGANL